MEFTVNTLLIANIILGLYLIYIICDRTLFERFDDVPHDMNVNHYDTNVGCAFCSTERYKIMSSALTFLNVTTSKQLRWVTAQDSATYFNVYINPINNKFEFYYKDGNNYYYPSVSNGSIYSLSISINEPEPMYIKNATTTGKTEYYVITSSTSDSITLPNRIQFFKLIPE